MKFAILSGPSILYPESMHMGEQRALILLTKVMKALGDEFVIVGGVNKKQIINGIEVYPSEYPEEWDFRADCLIAPGSLQYHTIYRYDYGKLFELCNDQALLFQALGVCRLLHFK